MEKSLNDTLRDEFIGILREKEFQEKLKNEKLKEKVLREAFNVLLKFKERPDSVDKARSEFENYLINYFKTKNSKNDNQ